MLKPHGGYLCISRIYIVKQTWLLLGIKDSVETQSFGMADYTTVVNSTKSWTALRQYHLLIACYNVFTHRAENNEEIIYYHVDDIIYLHSAVYIGADYTLL